MTAINALGVQGGPLTQCETSLKHLESSLRPKVGIQKLGQKLLWPFKQGEITSHIGRIERLKMLISLSFQPSLLFVTLSSAVLLSANQMTF
jgi:hypothetical protein